jgi:hypothetical protein
LPSTEEEALGARFSLIFLSSEQIGRGWHRRLYGLLRGQGSEPFGCLLPKLGAAPELRQIHRTPPVAVALFDGEADPGEDGVVVALDGGAELQTLLLCRGEYLSSGLHSWSHRPSCCLHLSRENMTTSKKKGRAG